jgi:hypothetical protein
MYSFPQISELPPSIYTQGWAWSQIQRSGHPSDGFWIGTDEAGNKWLTKLRGSFYAHREVVFGRLAQSMGWSCQSSVYAVLDAKSAELLGRQKGEVHALHWLLKEHERSSCSSSCDIGQLSNITFDEAGGFESVRFTNMRDFLKCRLAAYVFGANEPSGDFFTTLHEYVIIDSEQMFSSQPSDFRRSNLLSSSFMFDIAFQTCSDISSISQNTVEKALAIPDGLSIELKWSIRKIVNAGIELASAYLEEQPCRVGS